MTLDDVNRKTVHWTDIRELPGLPCRPGNRAQKVAGNAGQLAAGTPHLGSDPVWKGSLHLRIEQCGCLWVLLSCKTASSPTWIQTKQVWRATPKPGACLLVATNAVQQSTEPFQILNRNRICFPSGPIQRDLPNIEAGVEVPGSWEQRWPAQPSSSAAQYSASQTGSGFCNWRDGWAPSPKVLTITGRRRVPCSLLQLSLHRSSPVSPW